MPRTKRRRDGEQELIPTRETHSMTRQETHIARIHWDGAGDRTQVETITGGGDVKLNQGHKRQETTN